MVSNTARNTWPSSRAELAARPMVLDVRVITSGIVATPSDGLYVIERDEDHPTRRGCKAS
jgi:hypothetical protein